MRFYLFLCFLTLVQATWAEQFRALVFTKTTGYRHASIEAGVEAMRQLGQKHFFKVDWTEDPAGFFTDEKLAGYDVVVFLSTTGDVLSNDQKAAFQRFIHAGHGFVGVHSASNTEESWPWFRGLVGRMFYIHPEIQTARIRVVDSSFPGMERFPQGAWLTDEWYEFGPVETEGLHTLLTVDEDTYSPHAKWGDKEGKGMGEVHPLSWYHNYDGGRSFYTALGHLSAAYADPVFLQHLYGGIYWAATGKGVSL